MSIPERPTPVRFPNSNAARADASSSTATVPEATTTARSQPTECKEQSGSFVLPVIQEEFRVARRTITTGGVRIRREVDSREQILDQPLLSEEVHVDRRPLDPPLAVSKAPAVRHEGDTMIVSVVEERLVVEKRLFITEELHITRTRKTRHAPQRVVLRSERVIVERFDAPAAAAAPQTVSDIDRSAGDNMRSTE